MLSRMRDANDCGPGGSGGGGGPDEAIAAELQRQLVL